MRLFRYLTLAGIALTATALILLAIAPFHIYQRLTDERPIAELYFEPIEPDVFKAQIALGNLCVYETYLVYGDEWRLDAAFLKWGNLPTLLGAEPLYRIDRLSGRYSAVADENTRPRLAHALAPEVVIDPFGFSGTGTGWLIDTVFGSSVYQPIDPALRYIVYRSPSGLLVRNQRIADFTSEGGQTAIVIDRGCADRQPGPLGRLARAVNDFF